jgi:DNA polymerase III epsilon subunit family exonuclease
LFIGLSDYGKTSDSGKAGLEEPLKMVNFPFMSGYRNLICDTDQVNDAVEFLRSNGGLANALDVASHALNIAHLSEEIAISLIRSFIRHDSRITLDGNSVQLDDKFSPKRNLKESTYVVLDLETTGAKAPPCRITEIGAFKIENGEVTEEYHSLVNPQTPIPAFISQLTGIDDGMVADAPMFSDLAAEFLRFIGDSVVVAHNAQFDLRFINHEIGLMEPDHKLGNPHLCTVQISRKLVAGVENHRLNTLARHFDIPLLNHHRAKDDAFATAKIFVNLLDMLSENGVEDVESAIRLKVNDKTKDSVIQ